MATRKRKTVNLKPPLKFIIQQGIDDVAHPDESIRQPPSVPAWAGDELSGEQDALNSR
ncbi:MAG: hypothetical protein MRK02_04060 [Candidatus Scalindua sp.]|nr:hypothetical protein [Candidatus Scalindua sp.]